MFLFKENISTIIICGLTIICLYLGYKYHSVQKDYTELTIKYEQLKAEYAVSKANVQTLENSIDIQNKSIEKYKQESNDFQQQIKELNDIIINEKEIEYVTIEKNNTTAEEAIEWLRKQSSSLAY